MGGTQSKSRDHQDTRPRSRDVVVSDSSVVSDVVSLMIDALMLYGIALSAKYLYKTARPFIEDMLQGEKSKGALRRRLDQAGRVVIQTNYYEDIIAGDLVDPRDIDVTFEDIGGLEDQKRDLYDLVILPLQCPEFFASRGALLSVPKGILLYGQPGTGKTMLAKAIAKESGAFFINLKISTLMSKWFGESQKLVRAAFSLAQKLAPCIIFIDEVDSFMGTRRGASDQAYGAMKTEFMALWDGFTELSGKDQGFGVIVMGATNRPGDVDPAFLRRMPRAFDIGLPSRLQREKILTLLLRKEAMAPDLDLAELSRDTAGFSGSDLKELCRAALMIPLREHIGYVRSMQARRLQREKAMEANEEAATSTSRHNKIVVGADNTKIVVGAPDDEEGFVRPLSALDFVKAREVVQPTTEAANEYEWKAHGKARGASQPSSENPSGIPVDADLFAALMTASMHRFMAQYMQPPRPSS